MFTMPLSKDVDSGAINSYRVESHKSCILENPLSNHDSTALGDQSPDLIGIEHGESVLHSVPMGDGINLKQGKKRLSCILRMELKLDLPDGLNPTDEEPDSSKEQTCKGIVSLSKEPGIFDLAKEVTEQAKVVLKDFQVDFEDFCPLK